MLHNVPWQLWPPLMYNIIFSNTLVYYAAKYSTKLYCSNILDFGCLVDKDTAHIHIDTFDIDYILDTYQLNPIYKS